MKILIGMPAYNYQVHAAAMLSVVREIKESDNDISVMSNNSCLISHSRNEIVKEFLKQKEFDYLLFWDADVEVINKDFVSNMITLSLTNDDAIVCGAYRIKLPKEYRYNLVNKKNFGNQGDGFEYITKLMEKPFEVDCGGTGLMLISRRVLEKITYPQFDMPLTEESFFPEDWLFCLKAKEKGFKTMVDINIKTRHWGYKQWESHE